jgi:DNA-binding transcriptional LysR family regulator
MTGLLRGRLTVGMVTACTITALFDALDGFHRDHPGVALTLVEGTAAELTDQVRAGPLDLALIAAAEALPEGLDALPIVTERLVAAVPHSHPLAERARSRTPRRKPSSPWPGSRRRHRPARSSSIIAAAPSML